MKVEYQDALTAVEVARNHLDEASTPDEVDAACYELQTAEIRLNAIIKKEKELMAS